MAWWVFFDFEDWGGGGGEGWGEKNRNPTLESHAPARFALQRPVVVVVHSSRHPINPSSFLSSRRRPRLVVIIIIAVVGSGLSPRGGLGDRTLPPLPPIHIEEDRGGSGSGCTQTVAEGAGGR